MEKYVFVAPMIPPFITLELIICSFGIFNVLFDGLLWLQFKLGINWVVNGINWQCQLCIVNFNCNQ